MNKVIMHRFIYLLIYFIAQCSSSPVLLMKYSPTCMWLIYGTKKTNNNQNNKKQIRFTPPGAAAPGWGHAYRPTCLSQTITQCQGVEVCSPSRVDRGEKEIMNFFICFPLHIFELLHFFAPQFKVWFRGKRPECNEKYNWYLETDLMHQTALPKVHDLLAFEVYSQPPYCAHHIIIHSLH